MRRFSPRLFALGFALGAIGAAAILAVNAYASTGTAIRRGNSHAVVSAAGADVLASFVHTDHDSFAVTPEVLPGVERSFVLQNFLTSSTPGHR